MCGPSLNHFSLICLPNGHCTFFFCFSSVGCELRNSCAGGWGGGAEAVVGMGATHTEPVAFPEALPGSRDCSVIFRRTLWLGIKCQEQGRGSYHTF